MNDKMRARVQAHGELLQRIFPAARGSDPVALCKKLRRLEAEGNTLGVRLCNGPEFAGGYDEADKVADSILARVNALLGFKLSRVPVFLNRDPRGYALKVREDWQRQRRDANKPRLPEDWGGYGLIAPDVRREGARP